VLYPHHRKPYRVRHLASLLLALAVIFACIFELGVVVGHQGQSAAPPASRSEAAADGGLAVRSSYGFSFTADTATFDVSGRTSAGGRTSAVSGNDLKPVLPLISATVRPRPGAVPGHLAATEFSIRINPDPSTLSDAAKKPENLHLTPEKIAANLFPVTGGSEVTARRLSSQAAELGGTKVQKSTYEFTGKHGGKSYAVVWTGVLKSRPFAVELEGLVGSAEVPGEFGSLLNSLDLSDGQAVLGDSTFAQQTTSVKGALDSRYLSDALSPAVVQIFHTVCGTLTIDGQPLGGSQCLSFSGSGFLATSSGYIATNGHVVVYTAKDALADLVTSNDDVLQAYLTGLGLTPSQINAIKSDPAALAALVARIYDLPDSRLHFSGEGEQTLVALGSDQPDTKALVALKNSSQLSRFSYDSDTIKPARVVDSNYDPKDTLTAVADPKAGFSSSDVALLKVDVRNAPAIPIETGQVVQNERIVIMGFPGNADNPLTDNQQTAVTVTDGVVSSIREAAGGHGRLYQSDADASHGNSGGPAIDEQGKVIGLLTYRYVDSEEGDAPASYIRDIADFKDLAEDNGVSLSGGSSTQNEWQNGLELYSHSHYSAALKDFERVQAAYPAQRLVADYISSAKEAVANGQDVKDMPVDVLITVLIVALVVAGATSVLIIRHHAMHRVYRTSVPDAAGHQPVYLVKPQPSPQSSPSQPPQPSQRPSEHTGQARPPVPQTRPPQVPPYHDDRAGRSVRPGHIGHTNADHAAK
jgi:S1-C subfamily serine protease